MVYPGSPFCPSPSIDNMVFTGIGTAQIIILNRYQTIPSKPFYLDNTLDKTYPGYQFYLAKYAWGCVEGRFQGALTDTVSGGSAGLFQSVVLLKRNNEFCNFGLSLQIRKKCSCGVKSGFTSNDTSRWLTPVNRDSQHGK